MEKHAHVCMSSGHFHAFYQLLQNGKTKFNCKHKLTGEKGERDTTTQCDVMLRVHLLLCGIFIQTKAIAMESKLKTYKLISYFNILFNISKSNKCNKR